MNKIISILLLMVTSACSTVPEYLVLEDPYRHGLRDYDVCVRCGEEPVFINIDQTKEATDDSR